MPTMTLLVSGTTRTVARLAQESPRHLGVLLTPKDWASIPSVLSTGLPWAVDNGAYSGFSPNAFTKLMLRSEGQPGLLWVACPDVVGDAVQTARLFFQWSDALHRLKLPPAYVAQDGCEDQDLPWDEFCCLFLGGTTEWKLSDAAVDVAREAKARQKLLHMGRVNSRRRMLRAALMGCDSIDGSSASKFGDVKIPKYLRWLAAIDEQHLLDLQHPEVSA